MTSTPLVPLSQRPHWVYELIDANGQHVYIGCSSNLANRMGTWRCADWWPEVVRIETDVYPNQRAGLDAERALIEQYQPKYNTVHTERYDAGGWEGRRSRMAEAHESKRLCDDRTCERCHNLAHGMGLRCQRAYNGCAHCVEHMPRAYKDIFGAREAWASLVDRHGPKEADAWAWAAGDPVKAEAAEREGRALSDLEKLADERTRAAIVTRRKWIA